VYPGAGVVIYPAQNSSSIPRGGGGEGHFLNAFPSFVDGITVPELNCIAQRNNSSQGDAQYQHRDRRRFVSLAPLTNRPPYHSSDSYIAQ